MGTTHAERDPCQSTGDSAMSDFAFEVNIVAVVRVRAADENVALKVVPTVLGVPANVEIRLARNVKKAPPQKRRG